MSRNLWQQFQSLSMICMTMGGGGVKNNPNLRDVIYGCPLTWVTWYSFLTCLTIAKTHLSQNMFFSDLLSFAWITRNSLLRKLLIEILTLFKTMCPKLSLIKHWLLYLLKFLIPLMPLNVIIGYCCQPLHNNNQ